MTRRDFTLAVAAITATACEVTREGEGGGGAAAARGGRVPAAFVGHGAPLLAIDADKGAPFRRWGQALAAATPPPRAYLVLSAHWYRRSVTIGTTRTRPLMYDFSGLPEELYRVEYEAPGAPDLAERVAEILASRHELTRDPERPLDHGVWTPLVHLAPAADVPVLQLTLPSHYDPEALFRLGRDLSPLRDEGVLVLGSGNMTHNLREMKADGAAPEAWARGFDAWAEQVLGEGDVDALLAYRSRAPDCARNHPTVEHFVPLLVAAGAGGLGSGATVTFPVDGFEFGNLSRRAVQLA